MKNDAKTLKNRLRRHLIQISDFPYELSELISERTNFSADDELSESTN